MSVLLWKRTDVPKKQTAKSAGLWARTIPDALIREMRANPAATYQLLVAGGNPATFTESDVAALRSSSSRPYRIQSREVAREPKLRHVWVSMDPGHWERMDKARKGREQ